MRAIPAISMVATHTEQGSHEVYKSAPDRSVVLRLRQASRTASTSPCEVGSKFFADWFSPSPTILPSFTTTAPYGRTPGVSSACADSSIARRMNFSSYIRASNAVQAGLEACHADGANAKG